MIITRTPFRVSFVGGGTDIKDFYRENGYGAVISTAIKQYMYIIIHPYFHDKIRIKYSRTEDVEEVNEIKHPIVRECLRRVGIEKGVEIASFADISSGTGLGSSSAFTVGLLNALYAYKGKVIPKHQLASEACEIEIDILKEPIGKQDQFASAYGNVNYIQFNRDETVEVTPILLSETERKNIEKNLLLYYVGGQRSAREILNEQKMNLSADAGKHRYMTKMLDLVKDFKTSLANNTLDKIGELLHMGWTYKKELASGISNKPVDDLYDQSMKYGAKGGKLSGAGGTGFLLVFHEDHKMLTRHLNCKTIPFHIDREGTKIIYYE